MFHAKTFYIFFKFIIIKIELILIFIYMSFKHQHTLCINREAGRGTERAAGARPVACAPFHARDFLRADAWAAWVARPAAGSAGAALVDGPR